MQERRHDFDVLVIGAGSAGFSAALAASQAGMRVGIIERGALGGECPNRACVPTKVLLQASRLKSLGSAMSWKKAIGQTDSVKRVLTGNRLTSLLEKSGIVFLKGLARFADPHSVVVGSHEWTASKFVIAGGTETAIPEIPGLKETGFLTYADIVSLKVLPKSILILGGGPVAIEFAEILNGFGVKVTLIQYADRVLEREEPEVSAVIEEALRAKGVIIYTGAAAQIVARAKGIAKILVRQGRMEFELSAEKILVATGKRSLAAEMMVERAGVELDPRGYIKTDKFLRTSVPHIFAAGDVKAGPQFTHVATLDGEIVGQNLTHKNLRAISYEVMPRATFCSPEVASVGKTEEQARASGKYKVGVGRAFFAGFGKALTHGDGIGLVKVVVDLKTGKILGAGIVGEDASEMIHELALAMQVGATYEDIANMMHVYPTGSETVKMACVNVE
ncbi:MAG: NAD(P)/FAD-dependent oxidoreductase [bacterium]